ncbi:MAG: hypothetical protein Q8P17_00755 [bacterium]|nr:hypothetical protein [bacterium]
MKINDETLNEFMTLYRTEFGKDISQQDALEMATRLINLYLIIYRPLPGERGDKTTPPSEDHQNPFSSLSESRPVEPHATDIHAPHLSFQDAG